MNFIKLTLNGDNSKVRIKADSIVTYYRDNDEDFSRIVSDISVIGNPIWKVKETLEEIDLMFKRYKIREIKKSKKISFADAEKAKDLLVEYLDQNINIQSIKDSCTICFPARKDRECLLTFRYT